MISTRSLELVIDTVVCLTLAKWETVSGQFGGYLTRFTAGAAGFLNLSQCRVRPLTYGEPSRFDTMPSQPSLPGVAVDDAAAVLEVLDQPQRDPTAAQQARQ